MKYAIAVALLLFATVRAGEPPLRPFTVDWQGAADSPVSMAGLLDKPAGKDGFLRSAGGHLTRPSGARFRIWGVNLTGKAALPAPETAGRLADHLARCGVNCVRLHFLDRTAPTGLVDATRNDTRRLDPAQLERLDRFVAELKKRGVYTDLNLNVGRSYKPGDGVRDCELLGFAKALTYFHPRLVELQKEYAQQLLTHRNPYTGNEYRHEPAVALVELVNENSLVESWFSGRLLGKNTRKNPGTWTDIPAGYERELTELYNAWLAKQLKSPQLAALRQEAGVAGDAAIPRLRPDQFKKASELRFRTEAEFYMDVERRFYADMAHWLRGELGLKPLLLGTSDHNHGRSGYPLLCATSQLDVVDGHVYWQHPHYRTDPNTGRNIGFDIPNTPMVNDPLRSTVVQLSRTAMAGKPYSVSEVNHPFPHEYACEGIPILTAYALLHDWDALFWYTLAHEPLVDGPPRAMSYFDLAPDPVKMCQIAAGAITFLRGDVQAARQTIARSYSREQVLESLRLPYSESPYYTPGFPLSAPLQHSMQISGFDGPPTAAITGPASAPYVSDTGELRWSGAAEKQGLVTVAAPRSQAIVGFGSAKERHTPNMTLDVENRFVAVTLSALDDRPIAEASRLLLTACGRVSNSGMEWNAKHTSLEKWGAAPTQIESIVGAAQLRNLSGVRGLKVQALDGAGRTVGPAQAAEPCDGGWRVRLGDAVTTWRLI